MLICSIDGCCCSMSPWGFLCSFAGCFSGHILDCLLNFCCISTLCKIGVQIFCTNLYSRLSGCISENKHFHYLGTGNQVLNFCTLKKCCFLILPFVWNSELDQRKLTSHQHLARDLWIMCVCPMVLQSFNSQSSVFLWLDSKFAWWLDLPSSLCQLLGSPSI